MVKYLRRVLRVSAEDSPNVRLARSEIAAGLEPSGRVVTPGVVTYEELLHRRATWDAARQCVGLDGLFYEGAELKLFPQAWLDASAERAEDLESSKTRRRARAVGVDPGEGGAKTAWTAVDRLGLIEQMAYPTPDTDVIPERTIEFGRRFRVPDEDWVFDRGGGGKQHADRLRALRGGKHPGRGYRVRTVAFGESLAPPPRPGPVPAGERVEAHEERGAYFNRRAEMYGLLRELLDPGGAEPVFAIPARYTELRRQLGLIPLTRDAEGRLKLLPKNRPAGASEGTRTLTALLGCSPDEADSLVLAVWGMLNPARRPRVGAGFAPRR